MTIRSAFLALVAAGLALAASGCAVLSADNAAGLGLQQGIGLAVTVYVTHKGGGTQAGDVAVAQQVLTVATELKQVVAGNLTVTQFNVQLQSYIAKISNTVERQIAIDVLGQIDLYFAAVAKNQNGLLNATTQVAATIVLNDVIAAAQNFTGVSALVS